MTARQWVFLWIAFFCSLVLATVVGNAIDVLGGALAFLSAMSVAVGYSLWRTSR